MSALSAGMSRPGGMLLLIAAVLLTTATLTRAAPVYDQDTTQIAEYEGGASGCYYNFQRYQEGDRIITNEPCLNCTCHNRMLMCYLRVCPFTKAIGQDCTVEKRPDQCCPVITCPEVPVQLLTSTSTNSPAVIGSTEVGSLDNYGCRVEDKFFADGAQLPLDPRNPCELCYCIRNRTTCIMQECTLRVAGCQPVYLPGVCCPVKYNCDYDEERTTTVGPSTPGLIMTTTIAPGLSPPQCLHLGNLYDDGELIYSTSPCQHCYCFRGDIACAVQKCGRPMENYGKNCTALPTPEGKCCPDTYQCDGDEGLTKISEEEQELEANSFKPQESTSDESQVTETATGSSVDQSEEGDQQRPVEAFPGADNAIPEKQDDDDASTVEGTIEHEATHHEENANVPQTSNPVEENAVPEYTEAPTGIRAEEHPTEASATVTGDKSEDEVKTTDRTGEEVASQGHEDVGSVQESENAVPEHPLPVDEDHTVIVPESTPIFHEREDDAPSETPVGGENTVDEVEPTVSGQVDETSTEGQGYVYGAPTKGTKLEDSPTTILPTIDTRETTVLPTIDNHEAVTAKVVEESGESETTVAPIVGDEKTAEEGVTEEVIGTKDSEEHAGSPAIVEAPSNGEASPIDQNEPVTESAKIPEEKSTEATSEAGVGQEGEAIPEEPATSVTEKTLLETVAPEEKPLTGLPEEETHEGSGQFEHGESHEGATEVSSNDEVTPEIPVDQEDILKHGPEEVSTVGPIEAVTVDQKPTIEDHDVKTEAPAEIPTEVAPAVTETQPGIKVVVPGQLPTESAIPEDEDSQESDEVPIISVEAPHQPETQKPEVSEGPSNAQEPILTEIPVEEHASATESDLPPQGPTGIPVDDRVPVRKAEDGPMEVMHVTEIYPKLGHEHVPDSLVIDAHQEQPATYIPPAEPTVVSESMTEQTVTETEGDANVAHDIEAAEKVPTDHVALEETTTVIATAEESTPGVGVKTAEHGAEEPHVTVATVDEAKPSEIPESVEGVQTDVTSTPTEAEIGTAQEATEHPAGIEQHETSSTNENIPTEQVEEHVTTAISVEDASTDKTVEEQTVAPVRHGEIPDVPTVAAEETEAAVEIATKPAIEGDTNEAPVAGDKSTESSTIEQKPTAIPAIEETSTRVVEPSEEVPAEQKPTEISVIEESHTTATAPERESTMGVPAEEKLQTEVTPSEATDDLTQTIVKEHLPTEPAADHAHSTEIPVAVEASTGVPITDETPADSLDVEKHPTGIPNAEEPAGESIETSVQEQEPTKAPVTEEEITEASNLGEKEEAASIGSEKPIEAVTSDEKSVESGTVEEKPTDAPVLDEKTTLASIDNEEKTESSISEKKPTEVSENEVALTTESVAEEHPVEIAPEQEATGGAPIPQEHSTEQSIAEPAPTEVASGEEKATELPDAEQKPVELPAAGEQDIATAIAEGKPTEAAIEEEGSTISSVTEKESVEHPAVDHESTEPAASGEQSTQTPVAGNDSNDVSTDASGSEEPSIGDKTTAIPEETPIGDSKISQTPVVPVAHDDVTTLSSAIEPESTQSSDKEQPIEVNAPTGPPAAEVLPTKVPTADEAASQTAVPEENSITEIQAEKTTPTEATAAEEATVTGEDVTGQPSIDESTPVDHETPVVEQKPAEGEPKPIEEQTPEAGVTPVDEQKPSEMEGTVEPAATEEQKPTDSQRPVEGEEKPIDAHKPSGEEKLHEGEAAVEQKPVETDDQKPIDEEKKPIEESHDDTTDDTITKTSPFDQEPTSTSVLIEAEKPSETTEDSAHDDKPTETTADHDVAIKVEEHGTEQPSIVQTTLVGGSVSEEKPTETSEDEQRPVDGVVPEEIPTKASADEEKPIEVSVVEGEPALEEAAEEKPTEPTRVNEEPISGVESGASEEGTTSVQTSDNQVPTGSPIDDEEHEQPAEIPQGEKDDRPSVIPGEGNCLVDGKSYSNNSLIPPANLCQLRCLCISSIVHCDLVDCPPPPTHLSNCMPIHANSDSCCPIYSCESVPSTDLESDSQTTDGHGHKKAEQPGTVHETTSHPEIPDDEQTTVVVSPAAEVEQKPETPVEEKPIVANPDLKLDVRIDGPSGTSPASNVDVTTKTEGLKVDEATSAPEQDKPALSDTNEIPEEPVTTSNEENAIPDVVTHVDEQQTEKSVPQPEQPESEGHTVKSPETPADISTTNVQDESTSIAPAAVTESQSVDEQPVTVITVVGGQTEAPAVVASEQPTGPIESVEHDEITPATAEEETTSVTEGGKPVVEIETGTSSSTTPVTESHGIDAIPEVPASGDHEEPAIDQASGIVQSTMEETTGPATSDDDSISGTLATDLSESDHTESVESQPEKEAEAPTLVSGAEDQEVTQAPTKSGLPVDEPQSTEQSEVKPTDTPAGSIEETEASTLAANVENNAAPAVESAHPEQVTASSAAPVEGEQETSTDKPEVDIENQTSGIAEHSIPVEGSTIATIDQGVTKSSVPSNDEQTIVMVESLPAEHTDSETTVSDIDSESAVPTNEPAPGSVVPDDVEVATSAPVVPEAPAVVTEEAGDSVSSDSNEVTETNVIPEQPESPVHVPTSVPVSENDENTEEQNTVSHDEDVETPKPTPIVEVDTNDVQAPETVVPVAVEETQTPQEASSSTEHAIESVAQDEDQTAVPEAAAEDGSTPSGESVQPTVGVEPHEDTETATASEPSKEHAEATERPAGTVSSGHAEVGETEESVAAVETTPVSIQEQEHIDEPESITVKTVLTESEPAKPEGETIEVEAATEEAIASEPTKTPEETEGPIIEAAEPTTGSNSNEIPETPVAAVAGEDQEITTEGAEAVEGQQPTVVPVSHDDSEQTEHTAEVEEPSVSVQEPVTGSAAPQDDQVSVTDASQEDKVVPVDASTPVFVGTDEEHVVKPSEIPEGQVPSAVNETPASVPSEDNDIPAIGGLTEAPEVETAAPTLNIRIEPVAPEGLTPTDHSETPVGQTEIPVSVEDTDAETAVPTTDQEKETASGVGSTAGPIDSEEATPVVHVEVEAPVPTSGSNDQVVEGSSDEPTVPGSQASTPTEDEQNVTSEHTAATGEDHSTATVEHVEPVEPETISGIEPTVIPADLPSSSTTDESDIKAVPTEASIPEEHPVDDSATNATPESDLAAPAGSHDETTATEEEPAQRPVDGTAAEEKPTESEITEPQPTEAQPEDEHQVEEKPIESDTEEHILSESEPAKEGLIPGEPESTEASIAEEKPIDTEHVDRRPSEESTEQQPTAGPIDAEHHEPSEDDQLHAQTPEAPTTGPQEHVVPEEQPAMVDQPEEKEPIDQQVPTDVAPTELETSKPDNEPIEEGQEHAEIPEPTVPSTQEAAIAEEMPIEHHEEHGAEAPATEATPVKPDEDSVIVEDDQQHVQIPDLTKVPEEHVTEHTEHEAQPVDGVIEQSSEKTEKPSYFEQPITTTLAPQSNLSHTEQSVSAEDNDHFPVNSGNHWTPETDEEDYDEDDQTIYGPGTCRYGGKVYVSAQQIPRDDPCDFCFCFRSDIICLQQTCPRPIPGCHEEPISGFCCPRYNCPVSMATMLNVTTTTTTTTTTLPPHFLEHAYKGAARRSGCQIRGQAYRVGDVIQSASGPCLQCICGGDGNMKCEPRVCSPEPMLRQMIAAATARRRR